MPYGRGRRKKELRPVVDEAIRLDAAINAGANKAKKAFKYAALAHSAAKLGYGLGKQFVKSFSKSETEMAPIPKKRRGSASGTAGKGGNKKRKTLPAPKFYGRKGAQQSKSRGFFKKPRRKQMPLDKYGRLGIITCRENGGSIVGDATNKYQTVAVMHATLGVKQALTDLAFAITKMLSVKCESQIVNFANPFLNNVNRAYTIRFTYRTFPSNVNSGSFTINCDVNTTAQNVADGIQAQMEQLVIFPYILWEWCVIEYSQVATTPAVGNQSILRLNLQKCRLKMMVKSSLKLQNRTVNTAGNVEADDVDNVPLYGKSYEGNGNNFRKVESNNTFRPLLTDITNSTTFGFIYGDGFAEPPPLSQVRGAKVSGKAHLDPGEIKTSVLSWSGSYLLSEWYRKLAQYAANDNCVTIGKFRIFILEKMLQAVATTAESGIKLFYECDLKTGCIATAPKVAESTQLINLTPL